MTIKVLTEKAKYAGLGFPLSDKSAEEFSRLKGLLTDGRSPTALELFKQLDSNRNVVGVAFCDVDPKIEGGGGCASMYVPPWEGFLGIAPDLTGGVAVVNTQVRLNFTDSKKGKVELPMEITMAHELGHAAQYLEAPGKFLKLWSVANGVEGADASQVPRTRTRQETKVMVGTNNAVLNADRELNVNPKDIAMLMIENLNVSVWEAPICVEFDLPAYRRNYLNESPLIGTKS